MLNLGKNVHAWLARHYRVYENIKYEWISIKIKIKKERKKNHRNQQKYYMLLNKS